MKIEIPRILLELRGEVVAAKTREKSNRWERLAFRLYAWAARHPSVWSAMGLAASAVAPDVPAMLNRGPIADWLSQRDLPPLPPKTFRQLWRERERTGVR